MPTTIEATPAALPARDFQRLARRYVAAPGIVGGMIAEHCRRNGEPPPERHWSEFSADELLDLILGFNMDRAR